MSQCGLHDDGGAWTPARASARRQMLRDESVHDRFIELLKRQVLVSEPVRKVSDGVEIRAGVRGGIPAPLQQGLVGLCRGTQHTRGEPRAPWCGDHRCSSWKRRHVVSAGASSVMWYTAGIRYAAASLSLRDGMCDPPESVPIIREGS